LHSKAPAVPMSNPNSGKPSVHLARALSVREKISAHVS
jgi:hypothetical protein